MGKGLYYKIGSIYIFFNWRVDFWLIFDDMIKLLIS